MSSSLPPAIFLMGPTASGKTDVAVELIKHFPCEIISVDSALIYRGMDIGTAKPDQATLKNAPHGLIDICDPAEAYSAADFRRDALQEMAEITARGNVPLLVGGTMLYFKTLRDGLAEMPPADPAIRQAIEQEAAEKGWPAIHEQLAKVDPETAATLHPNHSQRIERALEVYQITGKPMSEFKAEQQTEPFPYRLLQMAIIPKSRQALHERIALRFEKMMESGFLAEMETLYERKDLHKDLPSIRAVGYRQAWDYLSGNLNRDEMIERAIIATRQLAKRQFTWLRNWPDLQEITLDTEQDVGADCLQTVLAEVQRKVAEFLH